MKKQFIPAIVTPRIVNGPHGQFTVYDIICDDGFRCSSPNPLWMSRIGRPVEVDVEERTREKNGVVYHNWYVIEAKKESSYAPPAKSIGSVSPNFVLAELKRLNEKIDRVLVAIEGLAVETAEPDGGPAEAETDLTEEELLKLPF